MILILINCTENCVYQNDGMCTLNNVSSLSNTSHSGCEFYQKKGSKKEEDNGN